MQMNPYLTFDGQCEAAFKFYAKVLGGKVEALMRFKGTPAEEHVPAGWAKKVLHSQLVAGKNVLMGSDAPPGRYEKMKGISVTLVFDDLKEGKRVFKALAKNGKVDMEFQETFWAAGFGTLVDQYGTPWMINCNKAG